MHHPTAPDGPTDLGASPRASFPTADGVAARAVFARLSAEVEHCAAMATDLQDVFGDGAGRDVKRAQSLDLLDQTLRDLGAVIAGIARGEDPANPAALVRACKLDDVARRLQGLSVAAHDDELEVF